MRVVEGFNGHVSEVLDGPYPGTEKYIVALDNDMGGGEYGANELSRARDTQASDTSIRTAADDYPELGTILHDRPNHQTVVTVHSVMAAETALCPPCSGQDEDAEHTCPPMVGPVQGERGLMPPDFETEVEVDEDGERHIVNSILRANAGWLTDKVLDHVLENAPERYHQTPTPRTPGGHIGDWCRFRRPTGTDGHCWYSYQLNEAATKVYGYAVWVPQDRGVCPRVTWEAQQACPVGEPGPHAPGGFVDATIPFEQGGQHASALHPEFAFHATAAWSDVRSKAKKIAADGRVHIIGTPGRGSTYITAEVQGDNDVYRTIIQRVPGKYSVATWECGCAWSAYSWGRTGRWKRFEGRMCSHALALTYEAQRREMFGAEMREDTSRPDWYDTSILPKTVYDKTKKRPVAHVATLHLTSSGDWGTDHELYAPPIIEMAKAMLAEGGTATATLEFIRATGAANPEALISLALKGSFWAKVRGRVQQVRDIIDGGVVLQGGEVVPAHEVYYPSYDPHLGLSLNDHRHGARRSDEGGGLPDQSSHSIHEASVCECGRTAGASEAGLCGGVGGDERSSSAGLGGSSHMRSSSLHPVGPSDGNDERGARPITRPTQDWPDHLRAWASVEREQHSHRPQDGVEVLPCVRGDHYASGQGEAQGPGSSSALDDPHLGLSLNDHRHGAKDKPGCTACSGTGEQGTGHECYICDGTGLASEEQSGRAAGIDNANPENELPVGRDDAIGQAPVTALQVMAPGPPLHPDHQIDVVSRDGLHTPHCTCGWTSPDGEVDDPNLAHLLSLHHVQDKTHEAGYPLLTGNGAGHPDQNRHPGAQPYCPTCGFYHAPGDRHYEVQGTAARRTASHTQTYWAHRDSAGTALIRHTYGPGESTFHYYDRGRRDWVEDNSWAKVAIKGSTAASQVSPEEAERIRARLDHETPPPANHTSLLAEGKVTEAERPDARDHGLRLEQAYFDREPRLTGLLRQTAKETSGSLRGARFRIKGFEYGKDGADGFVRDGRTIGSKIERIMRSKGVTAERAAGSMNDALRYTVVFDEDKYVAGVQRVLAALKEDGFVPALGGAKNYWKKGDPYDGINITMLAPGGFKWELQFHTPTGWRVKQQNHDDYEAYGKEADPAKRRTLYDRMVGRSASIEMPPGARNISRHIIADEFDPGPALQQAATQSRVEALDTTATEHLQMADPSDVWLFEAAKDDGPNVSGVVLKARDTGRILMLQRGLGDAKDPAAGTWEFPGGHHEDGDTTSLHAGIREWEEEVGQNFPEGGVVTHTWRSPNGVYQGHVVVIPEEKAVCLHQGRDIDNPDDPDGDESEQVAWWDVDHARKNPALRPEVKTSPWNEMKKAASVDVAASAGLVDRGVGDGGVHGDAGVAVLDVALARYLTIDDAVAAAGNPTEAEARASLNAAYRDQGDEWLFESGGPLAHTAAESYQTGEKVSVDGKPGYMVAEDEGDVIRVWEPGQFHSPHTLTVQPNRLQREAMTAQEFAERVMADLHEEPEPALPTTDGGDPDAYAGDTLRSEPGHPPIDPRHPDVPAGLTAALAPGTTGSPVMTAGDDVVAQFQAKATYLAPQGSAQAGDTDIAGAAKEFLAKEALKAFSPAERKQIIDEGMDVVAGNLTDLDLDGTHYAPLEQALQAQEAAKEMWT